MEDASRTGSTIHHKAQITDWVQAVTVPIELIGALIVSILLFPVLLAILKLPPPIGVTLLVAAPSVVLIALLGAIYSQISGYVFDPARDELTIPVYSLRRRIRLSEIRDANAEFAPSGTFLGAALAALANGSAKGPGAKGQKLYIVNLSGSFGSRQARFMSKKRRDQFLSYLRQYAPQARITRFAAWS